MKLQIAKTQYLTYLSDIKKLNTKTLKAYGIDLRQFEDFLNNKSATTTVNKIDKTSIYDYFNSISKNYKPKTLKRKMASLKSFFHYMELEEIIKFSPFHKLRMTVKESKTLPCFLTLAEINKIFNYLYKYHKKPRDIQRIAIFEIMFATGLRVSELCNLKFSDYSASYQTLKIHGKGAKERVMYIANKETQRAIGKHLKICERNTDYLFVNQRHTRLSEQSVRFFIKQIGEIVLHKHIHPHMIRHTFATLLLEEGVDIKYIQTFLGHSNITTTQIYAHASISKQRQILTHSHPRNNLSFS